MSDVEVYKRIIKSNGLKITKQRLAVIDVLEKSKKEHLKAEEIFNELHKKHPEFGVATVYRTLHKLYDIGLLDKIRLEDGIARYELAHSMNPEHPEDRQKHHHFICSDCHTVISFDAELPESLRHKLEDEMGCDIVNHEIKVYGVCSKCKNKRK